jgi:hypothetical protein
MVATNLGAGLEVPSATDGPAAYVKHLLDLAGDRDPFEVMATTPVRAFDLCHDTPASLIEQAPQPGGRSAALTIGHMYDMDIVYGFHWRLVATESDPVYPTHDQALWTTLPRLPFWQMLDAWTGLRASNIVLLRALPGESLQRTSRHPERGPETLEAMIGQAVRDDIGHLDQIYRALRSVRQRAGLDVSGLDSTYLTATVPAGH